MNCNTHGFIRLIRSSKAYAALTGTVLAIVPVAFSWRGMDHQHQADAAQAFATKVMAMWGTVIVMTGVEDAATNAVSGSSSTPPQALPPDPTPATLPDTASPQSSGVVIMPAVILLCLLGLITSGCQADPAYTTYRDGSQAIVEPVCKQYDQLMTDAVKTGLRTTNEQQIEQAEVAEIRDLYNKSKQTSSPSTRPAAALGK